MLRDISDVAFALVGRAAVQIRTGRPAFGAVKFTNEYRSRRLRRASDNQMIDQLRKAQSRRLAKATTVTADDQVVELQRDCPRPGGDRPVNSYTDFTRE